MRVGWDSPLTAVTGKATTKVVKETGFATVGLPVVVATTPAGLAAALAATPDVIAVNTASRDLPSDEAAAIVGQVAEILSAARPQRFLKKVDSRLKGNVEAESRALAVAIGAERILAAPAVPAQGRATRGGKVVGTGVTEPIGIAETFGAGPILVEVGNAELAGGIGILSALVKAGLAASNGEARRHIQSGAVRLNDKVVADERATVGAGDVLPEGVAKLSVGRKKHALLRPL